MLKIKEIIGGSGKGMDKIEDRKKYKKSGTSELVPTWRHHPDSNWGIKVLQTSALPLGYGAV